MIDFDKRNVIYDGRKYNMGGLDTQQVACHLAEIYKPERFLNNLKHNYNINNYMNVMTLVEGSKFDALLVDDKMFRFNKIEEEVKNEIYDCINRKAYATALLKLNESTQVIGSGLKHNFKLNESYEFVSKSMESLFVNSYLTNEKGKLVESFGNDVKVNIYEGNNHYIKGNDNKRLVEDWNNPFSISDIEDYSIKDVVVEGNTTSVIFTNADGVVMETLFEGIDVSNINVPTVSYSDIFKRSAVVSSYKIDKLNEYHQPFSINKAAFLSIESNGKDLTLNMLDEYGNKATVSAKLKITEKAFQKKYGRLIEELNKCKDWYDKYTISEFIMEDLKDDVESFGKTKNLSRDDVDVESYKKLSYKVHGFVPEGEFCKENDIDLVQRHPKNKDCFWVRVKGDGDRQYSLIFRYDATEPMSDFLDYINDKVDTDAWDFDTKQDVNLFFSELSNYGTPLKTYPLNISSAGRNYKNKKEESVMEGEGVQVSDIAPKLDQNVGLIKVKMKKRKKKVEESDNFNINDLLINTINEEDEFYGARGFIKDEKGRYHFNDYYVNEYGRVVHKSKLNEGSFADKAGKDGIHSYFDMVYGQEPQSKYDEMIIEYMNKMDEIDDKVKDLKEKFSKKEITERDFLNKLTMLNQEQVDLARFKAKAEEIPEDERGPLYQDFLEIDKENEKEFNKTHPDRLDISNKFDPVYYAMRDPKECDPELYKISNEYSDVFDKMCDVNTKRSSIYPGFDELEGAKKRLSDKDFKLYSKYTDEYYNYKKELRKISDRIEKLDIGW